MQTKGKTTIKRPAKPFTGTEGKKFSKENQPTAEAKKKGWQELRQERFLTQQIVKELIGEDGLPNNNFRLFIKAIFRKAKQGNPKAIDVIAKCMEDETFQPAPINFNFTNLNAQDLTTLLALKKKISP